MTKTANTLIILVFLCLTTIIASCSSGGSESGSANFDARDYGGVVNGFNAVRSVRYDEFGAVVGSTTYEHDPGTRTRTWTDFDSSGAISFTDICEFNDYGREVGCDSYDAQQQYTHTDTYTIENGLLTQRRRLNRENNDLLEIVDFNYEGDQLISRVYSSVDHAEALRISRRITYAYDSEGLRKSKKVWYDAETEYNCNFTYNDSGQLTGTVCFDSEGSPISVETWRYDENGNVDRRTTDGVWAITDYEYETSSFNVSNHLLRILKFWI